MSSGLRSKLKKAKEDKRKKRGWKNKAKFNPPSEEQLLEKTKEIMDELE